MEINKYLKPPPSPVCFVLQKKRLNFEPRKWCVCVCVFSSVIFFVLEVSKKYMLGKGPAKIAQTCPVGIESPNVRG